MPTLQAESFVFDARPHYPFLIPVKRYWNDELSSLDDDAATLILAHATSFVNEHWEPVLDDLYGVMATTRSTGGRIPKIRDAWAIGCPNHGDAAVWNEEAFADGYLTCKHFHHLQGLWLPVEWHRCTLSFLGRIRPLHSSGSIRAR
jgi:hypothetical protein